MRLMIAAAILSVHAAAAAPALYRPLDPNGTVGCVSQGTAAYMHNAMSERGFYSWEELKAVIPAPRWAYLMGQGGCLLIPPYTQWQEIGADGMASLMRLYPGDGMQNVNLYFPAGSMADDNGNPPIMGGHF